MFDALSLVDTDRPIRDGFPDAEDELVIVEVDARSRGEVQLDTLEHKRGGIDEPADEGHVSELPDKKVSHGSFVKGTAIIGP